MKLISGTEAEYIGDDLSILKEGARIIHWVGNEFRKTNLFKPDGTVNEGLCEPILKDDIGTIAQFERCGFVKIEKEKEKYNAYFAHR